MQPTFQKSYEDTMYLSSTGLIIRNLGSQIIPPSYLLYKSMQNFFISIVQYKPKNKVHNVK
jgi:hypothetical protein